jgi:hypothetical protein
MSRTPGSLTLKFSGICTHFRFGVVAGVPHRVVLPDATRLQTGLVALQNEDGSIPPPVLYYLTPHFPSLKVTKSDVDLTIPGFIDKHGHILSGVRLQVPNAVDGPMNYENDDFPGLNDFVEHYNFSSDVVLTGRAACYFDLFSGTLKTLPPIIPSGPRRVVITVTTDGPPELLVSPLISLGGPGQSRRIPLGTDDSPDVTLRVRNVEEVIEGIFAAEDHGDFDFLLHYLTARGGIPELIKKKTPGMPPGELKSVTKERMAQMLNQLSILVNDLGAPPVQSSFGFAGFRGRSFTDDDLNASCADSHYP